MKLLNGLINFKGVIFVNGKVFAASPRTGSGGFCWFDIMNESKLDNLWKHDPLLPCSKFDSPVVVTDSIDSNLPPLGSILHAVDLIMRGDMSPHTVEQQIPSGWKNILTRAGTAVVYTWTKSTDTPNLDFNFVTLWTSVPLDIRSRWGDLNFQMIPRAQPITSTIDFKNYSVYRSFVITPRSIYGNKLRGWCAQQTILEHELSNVNPNLVNVEVQEIHALRHMNDRVYDTTIIVSKKAKL